MLWVIFQYCTSIITYIHRYFWIWLVPQCMFYEQQYTSNQIPNGNVLASSPADCQVKCQKLSTCYYFSYSQGTCSLISRQSWPAQPVATYISGRKYCDGKINKKQSQLIFLLLFFWCAPFGYLYFHFSIIVK